MKKVNYSKRNLYLLFNLRATRIYTDNLVSESKRDFVFHYLTS